MAVGRWLLVVGLRMCLNSIESTNSGTDIGVDILLCDHFEGEEVTFGSRFFEGEVVGQMADDEERLSFWILVDEKVDGSRPQVSQIPFQGVVADEANLCFSSFLQALCY